MRAPVRFTLLGLSVAMATGCGGREPASGGADDPAAAVELDESSGARDILTTLGVTHATARAKLGPHRLHYQLELSMAPTAEPGLVPVGPGAPVPQSVTDTLDLVWASGDPTTFSIEQKNDHDRGRAMIVIGDRIYTRLDPRGWHHGDVETDGHEAWLDDAMGAAGDALEMVAPWANLTGSVDGEQLTFEIGLAAREDATLRPTRESASWRDEIEMETLEGTLVMHGPSRTWRSLELRASFGLDAAGTRVRGVLDFAGTLEPVDATKAEVSAPAGATPVPERVRYEPERRALLDGLAAP